MYKKASRRSGGTPQYGWSNHARGGLKKNEAPTVLSLGEVTLRTYLNCPFEDKDKCRALGGKWDKTMKRWYIPGEIDQKTGYLCGPECIGVPYGG
jgi:hypothetical protein